MNQPASVEKPAVSGLLRLLAESAEQQCNALRAQAEDKISGIRRQAFAQARERVGAAVADERERIAQVLGRVTAELETESRRRSLRRDAHLVEAGRRRLADVLARRWANAEARAQWLAALLAQSASVLITREWLLECPEDWPEDERLGAVSQAAAHQARLEVQAMAELDVGLRLRAGGMLVDMSISGLLADSDRIDGELLAIFDTLAKEAST